MFDELQRLRDRVTLNRLLTHYTDLGAADRQLWQDRVMALDGVEAKELTGLHGELIAHGWVEQNTGVPPALRPGAVPGCYRVTAAGLRALRQAQAPEADDGDGLSAAA